MKILLILLFNLSLYAGNCVVPNILLETVKITENETSYPFFIRTNEISNIEKFYKIVNNFKYKVTKEKLLINCLDVENCTYIATNLIENRIIDIDLGIFQINYKSYPKKDIGSYFIEHQAYKNVCEVIEDKRRIAKKWDWEVLANYYSSTPELNYIYKIKLIKNYLKLEKEKKIRMNEISQLEQ